MSVYLPTIHLAVGDTPQPRYVGYVVNGVAQDMSAAGWECFVTISDSTRTVIAGPRQITDTGVNEGTTEFIASMLISESLSMQATGVAIANYTWTVQVRNTAQNYSTETDYPLAVRSNLVA